MDWRRALLGLTLIALGAGIFLWLPLQEANRLMTALAHFGISVGALIALVGGGVVISAMPAASRSRSGRLQLGRQRRGPA
jgi:hypothetical protein